MSSFSLCYSLSYPEPASVIFISGISERNING